MGTTKPVKTKPIASGLQEALLETAADMRRSGLIDEATQAKITLRHAGALGASMNAPLAPEEIRRLREEANLSQAVFGRFLNLTAGYVSQLERGAKQANGSTLALLNVIRRKGLDAIL